MKCENSFRAGAQSVGRSVGRRAGRSIGRRAGRSIDQSAQAPHPRSHLRRDLRYSSWDCFLSSAMTGAGETFFPAFALAMGGSQTGSGLIMALPFLIGSTVQLAAPWALERVGSYRRWISWLAALQGFCFLPLLALAIHGPGYPQWLLYLVVTLYWACGLGASPAWNSWLAHLVPEKMRPRYFAKRSRLGQIGLLTGLACGGVFLQIAKTYGKDLEAFAALFLISGLFRLASCYCLLRHSEPEGAARASRTVPLTKTVTQLSLSRESGQVKLLGFLLVFAVAVHLSAPFFNAFMLQRLHLSYGPYIALVSVSFAAKILTYAALSRFARHMDPFQLMRFGLIGAALSPVTWLFSSSFSFLIMIQIFGGAMWASYEMGLMLSLFGVVKDNERTNVLSLLNFGTALMMLLGTVLGGQLLGRLGETNSTYFLIFGLSSAARFLALIYFDRAVSCLRAEPAHQARAGAAGYRAVRLTFRPMATRVQSRVSQSFAQARAWRSGT